MTRPIEGMSDEGMMNGKEEEGEGEEGGQERGRGEREYKGENMRIMTELQGCVCKNGVRMFVLEETYELKEKNKTYKN